MSSRFTTIIFDLDGVVVEDAQVGIDAAKSA